MNLQLGSKLSQILAVSQDVAERNVAGEYWECGVWKGGSSRWLAFTLSGYMAGGMPERTLRLFDTFSGRPEKTPEDGENSSEVRFSNTSLAEVQALVPWPFVRWHVGLIPETFAGLEDSRIAFAYVDLDLYRPTLAALRFILPRLAPGGRVLVDDYGSELAWPGMKPAVEKIMAEFAALRGSVVQERSYLIWADPA